MVVRKMTHTKMRRLVFGPRPEPLPLPSELRQRTDGSTASANENDCVRKTGAGPSSPGASEPHRAA